MSEDDGFVQESFVPEYPWDFQQMLGHDLVKVLIEAQARAEDNGADSRDSITSGLMEVFKVLAWELDSLPMPPDQPDKRTLLIQHVLHRLGDQGAGQ